MGERITSYCKGAAAGGAAALDPIRRGLAPGSGYDAYTLFPSPLAGEGQGGGYGRSHPSQRAT
jgi:hypothetical protein